VNGNDSKPTPGDLRVGPGSRVLTVIGIALFAGLTVWFVTGCNRDDTGAGTPEMFGGDSRIVPTDEVASIPDEIGHTVFWAGERPDTEVEMSDDPAGNVHLRYLTGGAEAGAESQTYLDIGTYPFEGAFQTTRALASQENLARVQFGDAVGFFDRQRPYSVILAFPDQPDLQVEVYHPEKNGALGIVRSGDIVPVP